MATVDYRIIKRQGIHWRVSILDDGDTPVSDLIQPNDPPGFQQAYRDAVSNGTLRFVGVEVRAVGIENISESLWGVEYGIVPSLVDNGDVGLVGMETYLNEPYMTVDGKDVSLVDSLINDALSGVTYTMITQMRAVIAATESRFA